MSTKQIIAGANLRPHERRYIEQNSMVVLEASNTHLLLMISQPDYRLYELQARYDSYMMRRGAYTTVEEGQRAFAPFADKPIVVKGEVPDDLKVAQPEAIVLQLIVQGAAIRTVKAALASVASVARTNLRDTAQSDADRAGHAAIVVMMLNLIEQIERHDANTSNS